MNQQSYTRESVGMKRINIYWIGKNEKDEYSPIEDHLLKLSSKFSKIDHIDIFNRDIIKRQNIGIASDIRDSYGDALKSYISSNDGSYSIILDPSGVEFSTEKFTDEVREQSKVNFFIGGAYGFNPNFLKNANRVFSLSKLTMSHKLAKVVLLEQIYRALTIINNHPYHK